ncbi:dipeptidase PepE [Psychroflexus tropicus]|uniref:dipeptidase PepE n=1 Tax=Psychroflexus tropicus TaxID=197345 RepID=UPI0003827A6C|nr:dipeptidase PepE [Psychroflexus tropicus]
MQAIIASTSTTYGSSYLEYLLPVLKTHFEGVEEVLFIPFARPGGISHDEYTSKTTTGLQSCVKSVKGLHEFNDMPKAVRTAKAIFVGGGNTFLLVKQLHDLGLMTPLKESITNGAKYLGTSAGSNICGLNMQTTNDMPIVYPPSFHTLGLLDFNINPHYLEPNSSSTHKGETRETRIKEFQALNDINVVGLKEGSWIKINGGEVTLEGELPAVIFTPGNPMYELDPSQPIKF